MARVGRRRLSSVNSARNPSTAQMFLSFTSGNMEVIHLTGVKCVNVASTVICCSKATLSCTNRRKLLKIVSKARGRAATKVAGERHLESLTVMYVASSLDFLLFCSLTTVNIDKMDVKKRCFTLNGCCSFCYLLLMPFCYLAFSFCFLFVQSTSLTV